MMNLLLHHVQKQTGGVRYGKESAKRKIRAITLEHCVVKDFASD